MSTFKTPKGTELPFLNLKGKDYLTVPYRVLWFREEKPDWNIETTIHTLNAELAVVYCEISDPTGRVLAKAHKMQTAKGFPAFLEKAESGAIGRALGFLGYGTAHAQELEDEDVEHLSTLADSPVPQKKAPAFNPSEKPMMPFGKTKGTPLVNLSINEIESALAWAKSKNKFEEFQADAEAEIKRRSNGKPKEETIPEYLTEDIPF